MKISKNKGKIPIWTKGPPLLGEEEERGPPDGLGPWHASVSGARAVGGS